MKILYVASDQMVPGRTGGSIHVLEVAQGLAARGHEVHAVVRGGEGLAEREQSGGVTWHRVSWFPPHRFFRFRLRGDVNALLGRIGADVVMERYYNFGGEGLWAARAHGIPTLLEVNSPLLDHAGSWKAALDAVALVRPMRRYRERLCREAAALVTPLPEIVPGFAREKTVTVTWGANVDIFHPSRRSLEVRSNLGVPEGSALAVFSSSSRPWHGVHVLEEAARHLKHRDDVFFLLVGGKGAHEARGYRGRGLGPVPYERMPEILASADIGLAPYDTSRLGQLRLGFYWSPLKIFEYMASGLPTVTIPRFPLTEIVREGEEGLHACEGDAAQLAAVIERLADDRALRADMGVRARERVVERYSWAHHCRQLEEILEKIAS